VATLLPAMLADLNLSIDRLEQATPIVAGFLAGYVVAMPLLGAYSDARGRVRALLIALGVFAAGSVVTGLAGSLGWLIAGRAVQGLGGGALVPLALAMAADSYSGGARLRALGTVAAVQEAGSVMGPVYGTVGAALLAGAGGWRAVFLLDVPVAVAIGAALWFLGRPTPATPNDAAAGRIDWASAVLLAGALGGLVAGLYPQDPQRSALNPLSVPLLIAAAVLLVAFAWRQWRRLEPLLPEAVMRSPGFWGALGANLLVGGALIVALVDIPIFARGIFDVDQNQAGLLLTAFLAGVPLGALAGGWLAARLGRRRPGVAGLLLAAAFYWVLSGWGAGELHNHMLFLRRADLELAALGFGFGVVIAPLAAAALDASRREHALVSSLVVAARTIGMLVGLAALTAFGLHRFNQLLAQQPPPPASLSLSDRLRYVEHAAEAALLLEYHEIFLLAAGLCVLAAAVCLVSLRSPAPHPAAAG
jgi:MFS family permease